MTATSEPFALTNPPRPMPPAKKTAKKKTMKKRAKKKTAKLPTIPITGDKESRLREAVSQDEWNPDHLGRLRKLKARMRQATKEHQRAESELPLPPEVETILADVDNQLRTFGRKLPPPEPLRAPPPLPSCKPFSEEPDPEAEAKREAVRVFAARQDAAEFSRLQRRFALAAVEGCAGDESHTATIAHRAWKIATELADKAMADKPGCDPLR